MTSRRLALQLINVGALGMSTGPARNVADEHARLRVALDDELECLHGLHLLAMTLR